MGSHNTCPMCRSPLQQAVEQDEPYAPDVPSDEAYVVVDETDGVTDLRWFDREGRLRRAHNRPALRIRSDTLEITEFYHHGDLHRGDGPARICEFYSGAGFSDMSTEWWTYGEFQYDRET